MKMAMKAAAAATVIRSSIIVLVFLSLMVSGAWNECGLVKIFVSSLFLYAEKMNRKEKVKKGVVCGVKYQ